MTQESLETRKLLFDVFLSYSSRDKPIADAVCHALEAHGLRCWIAPRDIIPGASWSEAIIEGLDASRVFVLIFSSHTNHSKHVLREVERAVDKSIALIPFRVENVMPSCGLEYCISIHHWLDAITPPLQQHIDRLLETVAAIIAAQSGQRHSDTSRSDPKNAQSKATIAWLDDAALSRIGSQAVCDRSIMAQRYDALCPSEFYRGYATILTRIGEALVTVSSLTALNQLIGEFDLTIKALPLTSEGTERVSPL